MESDNISFPTLTVRDPNELFTGNKKEKSADSIATPRPVFRPNVLEIAEEIKKINEIEAKKIDSSEDILAEVEAEEMINEIVDVLAEEIVAEELAEEIKEMANV